MAFLSALRIRQIRYCSRCATNWAQTRFGRSLLRIVRSVPGMVSVMAGYRQPRASLLEAAAAVRQFDSGGHTNLNNANLHQQFMDAARPSDYAAFFHLLPICKRINLVFDLGGNVGNLYYCYTKYLEFGPALNWVVQDLAEIITRGGEIATARSDKRIVFTSSFKDAEGADLFIASGSLHYFEVPLPEMISALTQKPRYVLINRTPMTDKKSFATVQDASSFRVPCVVYNREAFITQFEEIGYQLRDRWEAAELSLDIPFYPELSVSDYTGMFFERNANERRKDVNLG